MPVEADHILSVLDRCCDQFTFPMLDNGYLYTWQRRVYRCIEQQPTGRW